MPIRVLFLVCMSAVAALATCLGGWVLTQKIGEYALAGRIQNAVEIDALLFVVSDRIGQERPVVGDALLGDAPIDAPTTDRLARIRQSADAALQQVEARAEAVSYSGAAEQLAVVRKTRADLAVWRAAVDAALRLPRTQRDPDIFARFIASLNNIFDATSVALDLGDLAASHHDGASVELMALARHVWAVRAIMGVRTVPLMAAIDAGVPLTPTELEAQSSFDGELRANWTPITALARRLARFPGLDRTIAVGRAASEAYERLCHAVMAAGRGGTNYPISALDLGRTVIRTAPLLLKIRDDALAAANDRVAASRRLALANVLIAGIVLALTAIATITVLILLQRRIVSPMLALTNVIGRIAQLDFSVEIPDRERVDEIGQMATALEALRRGAVAGEENKAQIVRMARHDALTGLPNRVAMQEELEKAVAMGGRGQTSAVLCLDLDRFKAVNDTFGHPTGDLLLRAVADRLQACVRDVDSVSRLGGDEFVVLLVDLQESEQASRVAERIVKVMGEPFELDGQVASVGASVGIALTPMDANSAVTLLKRADTALYRAKQEGKNGWRFFQPEMDMHLQGRAALERDLRVALATDAFELAYQPQYLLATDRQGTDMLCGFEALLRWRHPERGMISPAEFIPIAEETGLIEPIGTWVLRQACSEAVRWPDHVKLAVNLSGVQFRNPALADVVRQALADAGLAANRLEMEITETVLINNGAANLAILNEMHEMGVQIAMDDFGTGYSSLSTLRSFPFDQIKIDQSFVRDVSHLASAREIVRAIVALARSLSMTTTAEGVETPEQLAELRGQGCTYVQGYLFSKPVPPEVARRLIGGEVAAA
jgi:diguanylate cyclase (GGDEF)-like protein